MYAFVAEFISYFILLQFSLWTSSSNSEMSCTFRSDSKTRPPLVRVRSVLGTGQLRLWNTSFRHALFGALLSEMRLRTWNRLLLSDCSVWRMETKLVWYINPPQSPGEASSAPWHSISMSCDSSDWHFQMLSWQWWERCCGLSDSLWLAFYCSLYLIHKHTVLPAGMLVSDLHYRSQF